MLRPICRIFCLLLCVAVPVIHAADKGATESRVQLYYGLAEGNYMIGDLKGASRGIEQILRIQPNHQPTLKLKTRVLLDAGDPEAALEVIDQAIESAPEDSQSLLLKALVLGNLNRREDAVQIVESVQAQSTPGTQNYQTANQLLGLLQMAAGDWDAAADAFNRNSIGDPETANLSRQLTSDAYLEKARTAVENREHQAALAALDEAIDVHTNEDGEESFARLTQLRLIRARYLTQIGQTEEAIVELRNLNGQQPENLEILITLASLYASSGKWDALEKVIDPIAAQAEMRDIALYLKGRADLAKGRAGSARAHFEEALELLIDSENPLRAYVLFFHGACLEKLGREDEAETEILSALESGFRPESGEDAVYAAQVLMRTQAHERAIPILEAYALNQLIPDPDAWAMLGRAHRAKGQYALALSAFNESLSIDPLQADTLALRGSLLRRFGDLQGAAADYTSALTLAADNHTILYALGLVQLQRGKLQHALDCIQTSNTTLNQPGNHLLIALLYYALESQDQAQATLETYLASAQEDPNETAFYLEYILSSEAGRASAVAQLEAHASARSGSDELGYFLAYCKGLKSRKDVLDLAGQAPTPEQARKQICEAAFWLAQQEQVNDNQAEAGELLKLATEVGSADFIEYQLASWQLARLK